RMSDIAAWQCRFTNPGTSAWPGSRTTSFASKRESAWAEGSTASMRPCEIATAWSASTPAGSTGTTWPARISVSMACMSVGSWNKKPRRSGVFCRGGGSLLLHALELDVHAAVLLAAFRGLVGRHGLGLALADRGDLRGRDALAHQVRLHRGSATLRELLVVRVAADRIGVAGGDHHLEVHAAQLVERLVDALLAVRTDHRLVEVEERIGLDHDRLAHRRGRGPCGGRGRGGRGRSGGRGRGGGRGGPGSGR